MITSLTNPKIKKAVALRERKRRKETGCTIVEGVREVMQALDAGTEMKEVFICRALAGKTAISCINKIRKKCEITEVSEQVFAKIAYGQRAEGVLAIGRPELKSLGDLQLGKQSLYVLVESVEKPGNLGAILRTCDGAGVDGVIICDGSTDIFNPNVIRSSLGTVFTNTVVVAEKEEALAYFRTNGIDVVAATPSAKTNYFSEDFKGASAILVGSEQEGLSDYWLSHADKKVRIPMSGKADSLNVSASTAVILYEIVRQRNG